MKISKVLFYLVLFSFTAASTIVHAENDAQVKAAIEQTVAKLEEAVAAIDKGSDTKAVVDLVLEAKQAQKSISTSDPKVAIKKAQGSKRLGDARTAYNDGDTKKGAELVKEALVGYKEVKDAYFATH